LPLHRRLQLHFKRSLNKSNSDLSRAIRHHSHTAFTIHEVESFYDKKEALRLEGSLILELNSKTPNGYNMSNNGVAGLSGKLNPMFGKTISDKMRENIRLRMIGNRHLVGHKHSIESRAKMSRAQYARYPK
jgi:NUMOD3 motif